MQGKEAACRRRPRRLKGDGDAAAAADDDDVLNRVTQRWVRSLHAFIQIYPKVALDSCIQHLPPDSIHM